MEQAKQVQITLRPWGAKGRRSPEIILSVALPGWRQRFVVQGYSLADVAEQLQRKMSEEVEG